VLFDEFTLNRVRELTQFLTKNLGHVRR